MNKAIASTEALNMIKKLKSIHGDLVFQLSSGCCDGTFPLCVPAEGLYISSQSILLDTVNDVPFYIDKTQQDYLKYTQIKINLAKDVGSSFSLENALGYTFTIEYAPLEQKK